MQAYKIKNANGKTATLGFSDNVDKDITVDIHQLDNASYTVATIDDFPTEDIVDGTSCIVKDLDRGGLFLYDSSKVADNNDGTNFNGWIRQYSGAVNVKWCLDGSEDIPTTLNKISTFINATPTVYEYFIPHDVNYGSDIAHNKTPQSEFTVTPRDFIVIDNSIDNGYSTDAHQGGQVRTALFSSEANDGKHNSFSYLTSQHHPGMMYSTVGDGIDSDGTLTRNSTTFFHTLDTGYEWGIGMGGNTITPADSSNVTADEELNASGFKIIAGGMKGNLGLSNIHNISLKTGNVGWFSGVNPNFKYQFGFETTDTNKQFVLKSDDAEYPQTLIISKTGYWSHNYSDGIYSVNSNLGPFLEYKDATDESRLMMKGQGDIANLTLYNTANKNLTFRVETNGVSTIGTASGNKFTIRPDGNFEADLGVSGSTTTTAGRPSANLCANGTMMFDTDLGKPIWLPNKSSNTWVDATGAVV